MKNIIHKPKLSVEEVLFDVKSKRFNSEAELHKFVVQQISNGHESGRVMDFFRKYKTHHRI